MATHVVDRTGSSKAVRADIANSGYVYYGPWATGRSAIYLNTTSGYQFNRVGDQPTSSTDSRYYVDYYLR